MEGESEDEMPRLEGRHHDSAIAPSRIFFASPLEIMNRLTRPPQHPQADNHPLVPRQNLRHPQAT